MTQVATPPPAAAPEPEPVPEGHVRLTIDGISVIAPKGELVIRTAERIGTAIPRFCDHPLLDPVGACLECLLINHPLDCPVCDKGGECPLQNQTIANGSSVSRMREPKRVFTKPIAISTEILLDRERCVL